LTITSTTVIEDAVGGDGNDTITGNSVGNRLVGGRGSDTLSGGVGRDLLDGGRGADTLTGGADADLFVVRRDADASVGSPVSDTITDFSIAGGDRVAVIGLGNVTSFGQLLLTQEGANTRVSVSDSQTIVLNSVAATSLTGSQFVFLDQLTSSGVLFGTTGADVDPALTVSDSRPTLIVAGLGNDGPFGGSGSDEIYGGAGDDQLVGENSSDGPLGTVGGRDKLYGEDGNDRLYGGAGDDVLIGGTGLDVMIGGYGRDTIYLDGESPSSFPSTFGAWGDSGNRGAFPERYSDTFVVLPVPSAGVLPNAINDFDLPNTTTGFEGDKIDVSAIAGVASFADLRVRL
jgi:Ca2+-binding RTX toxin-like protein